MPWSVVVEQWGKRQVLDVHCRGGNQNRWKVVIENKDYICEIGFVQKMGRGGGWGTQILPHPFGRAAGPSMVVNGFATRRYAIEHLLRMAGFWPVADSSDHMLPQLMLIPKP